MERDTDWRTEIVAGCTTFAAMAYIIFVNPALLAETGMPIDAVTIATCVCAALGSILMGLVANLPLALAPGMGLNAYFTYSVVKGMGVPWQVALGAVFLSGVVFLGLTLAGIRQLLVAAIPRELHAAVSAGIGLFIAFVGLRNAGIIVSNKATTVALGNLRAPSAALALFGILLITTLQVFRVRAAILAGVLGTLLIGVLLHQVAWHPRELHTGALGQTALQLNIRGALHLGGFEILFVFLFVDLFDNIGTLLAVAEPAGLVQADGTIQHLRRIFLVDAVSTVAGALIGTSTVTSYVESGAGVAAGGRTGVAAVTTGLLFLVSLAVAPLTGPLPGFATAPALVMVGVLMMASVVRVDWTEPRVALPAFLTLLAIPLTYSIATGVSLGLLAFAVLELVTGRARRDHSLLYALAALLLMRFLYLSHA
ncbi:NCS2 family permease [Acidipila sp. EB88]|uniref:NCS2 family permease n=1 Tax=Acidipila sp. EB88 TaxID=2305226 RepID=UPI000F5F6F78|nr:NCS2 family permease [Acidipila sp. EB88]RRA50185.1 NCS2 family permease [Acidipila sp. EB88]